MAAITVLVPIYNVEAYLRQALESLQSQSFRDFEVLCINDGSTDASRAIIQDFVERDERFKALDKQNSGYGDSLNQGLELVQSDYVAILEPDDYYEPQTLKLLYRKAEETGADIVKGNYWFYWSTPAERNQLISVITPQMANHLFDPYEETDIFFAIPSIWSALYRTSYLGDHDIRFLTTPGASHQDTSFTFKLWLYGPKVYGLSDGMVHYRQDNEASSINDEKKAFCICDELAEIEHVAQRSDHFDQLKGIVFRIKYDNYLWNYARLGKQLRQEFLAFMVADLERLRDEGWYVSRHFRFYQQKNLEFLLKDPQKFFKTYPLNPTQAAKAKYYLKIGGVRALADIAAR